MAEHHKRACVRTTCEAGSRYLPNSTFDLWKGHNGFQNSPSALHACTAFAATEVTDKELQHCRMPKNGQAGISRFFKRMWQAKNFEDKNGLDNRMQNVCKPCDSCCIVVSFDRR